MGGACNFIFSKSVLGLVAISASACLHERKQNLAIRSHAYDRHTCILDLPSSRAGRRRGALINRSGTVKSRSDQKPVKYRFPIFLFRQREYCVDICLHIESRLRVPVTVDALSPVNWLNVIIAPSPSRDLAEDVAA
jgi:hypothetical protein